MKIAVVGSGGREHAIIKKIKENKDVEIIYEVEEEAVTEDEAYVTNGWSHDNDGKWYYFKNFIF